MNEFQRKTLQQLCHARLWICLFLSASPAPVLSQTESESTASQAIKVEAEISRLGDLIPGFQTVKISRKPAEIRLNKSQGFCIEQLRGRQIDRQPPQLKPLAKDYPEKLKDGFDVGRGPYVPQGISPFRLQFFNCEFNYGGRYNFEMTDYASTHGFKIISLYQPDRQQFRHFPDGTKFMHWTTSVNWNSLFRKVEIPVGRFDLLEQRKTFEKLKVQGKFKFSPPTYEDSLMIDMEHAVLSPASLRKQAWYPSDATEQQKSKFENRYFSGYAKTYTAAVDAAREQGWHEISVYGWAPFGRTWGGLEQPIDDHGLTEADEAWQRFGKKIYDDVDVINNSVYCFYWSQKNVAFTLANIDKNIARVQSAHPVKPVRPYYWTLLHGGGGGYRWWREMPLPTEEQRAMTAMAFFTGIDGFDCWNWSATSSHHRPVDLLRLATAAKSNGSKFNPVDVMIGLPFDLTSAARESVPTKLPTVDKAEHFQRYDVVHITGVDIPTKTVRFQKIRPDETSLGLGAGFPTFQTSVAEIDSHAYLRSQPIAAMIEGMALVKPIEFTLHSGTVHIDVPAQKQFRQSLPIVRRVSNGRYHVVITYDPGVIHGGTAREIVLQDFGGVEGLTLTLPADDQTRIFILQQPAVAR